MSYKNEFVPVLIFAASFKFDVPSPDDIVSNGLHSSKKDSKGTNL